MMRRLLGSERGAGAVEFALAAPVLFTLIVGIAQLGILFFANAGLQNAIAEGARLATIYPMPSDERITEVILGSRFGMQSANIVADPEIVHGTDANGLPVADISLSYRVPLNFIFFDIPAITLSESRRVYTQPAGGGGSSTGGAGSGSSSGSSASSGGGDAADASSSTTASSSTSTSTSSTSTSTSSTSSSSGNGNGNGHGNGNGSSGNCHKC